MTDILIVDDAADQLQFMIMVFSLVDPNLKIATALGGDEALRLMKSDNPVRPRVVLLDVRMPGKSGIEVLKEMKADPQLKYIPVCTFSNGDVQKDVCECYENGASFYFKKPCGLEPLKQFAEHFRGIWFDFASHCESGTFQ